MSGVTALRAHRMGHGLCFMRHLVEMTVAMVLGMVAYGALLALVLGAAGSEVEDARLGEPELFALGMATAMSAPMVAWMRHRGHSWRNGLEMSAAMYAPALALITCYWLGQLTANAICPLACAAMIPAMIVAMLVRLEDYGGHPLAT